MTTKKTYLVQAQFITSRDSNTHTHLCEERQSQNQEVLPRASGGYFELKNHVLLEDIFFQSVSISFNHLLSCSQDECSCASLVIALPDLLKKLCVRCPIIHSRLNSTQCIYPDFTLYGTRFFLSFIYPFIYPHFHPSVVMF